MNPSSATGPEKIGLVICTHNRATRLRLGLESVARQTLPLEKWSLVIVDDGSTDSTPQVISDFLLRQPNATAVRQENSGLGSARNTGWRALQTRYIAFLDDDAIAPPEWLATMLAEFQAAAPMVAAIGGPVDPEWEVSPPAWLSPDLYIWLTVFDLGPNERDETAHPIFAGANMAFRRRALEQVGGFPANLGRRGTSLLSHEESAIWSALAPNGWINRFSPHPRVQHFVPADRLSRNWFRRRLFWEGISMARRESESVSGMTVRKRVRRWVGIGAHQFLSADFLQVLVKPWRWSQEMRWQANASYQAGFLWESLRSIGRSP